MPNSMSSGCAAIAKADFALTIEEQKPDVPAYCNPVLSDAGVVKSVADEVMRRVFSRFWTFLSASWTSAAAISVDF